jgi:hypothetical protein
MSELAQAQAELESATAPLAKSDAPTSEPTPSQMLSKALDLLEKALGTSGHKNAPTSESMPGQSSQALALKGDKTKRDHAIDQARVSNKEARGDSPAGCKDETYPDQALVGNEPEENMDEFLPGETPDQAAFRGSNPSKKGVMAKSKKAAAYDDGDGDDDGETDAALDEEDPDDGEGEQEQEEDEAPPKPPKMAKSKKAVAPAPLAPTLTVPADEDTVFKSIVMNDTQGTYTSVVEASDAMTYLTDELVKSITAQGRVLAENDQKLVEALEKSSAVQTKLSKENAGLRAQVEAQGAQLAELGTALVALMKSNVAVHESLEKSFAAPTPAAVVETPAAPARPVPPPPLVYQNPYGQYHDTASYTSRTQQDAVNAQVEAQLAKSQAALVGAEQPMNKSMVLRKLEQGVKQKMIDPSYIARLDSIGPEATIAQLPENVRVTLGF